MKRLLSLVLILVMLTGVSSYANTAVTTSISVNESENIMGFIENENIIISGDFKYYENSTLNLQLKDSDYETSVYDSEENFKDILETYEKGEKMTLYVAYDEATFKLLDVLKRETQIITGQIKNINGDTFDILTGDIVKEYKILNSSRHFVKEQHIIGYTSSKGTYLMPTIDTSNQNYNTFGELIKKSIIVNNNALEKNAHSVDGTLMVPLRETLEALGYEVKWNNDTRSVDINKFNQWTSIKINENSYFKNRMAHQKLSHAPVIINDLTYIPVEFLNVILDLGLKVDNGNLIISENQMVTHSGYIQNIDYKASGQISITLSLKEMPDSINDLTIIHASTKTTYFNSTLKKGELIHVISPPIMTMSIPGQTSGIVIY